MNDWNRLLLIRELEKLIIQPGIHHNILHGVDMVPFSAIREAPGSFRPGGKQDFSYALITTNFNVYIRGW
jgi:hypothetical protein